MRRVGQHDSSSRTGAAGIEFEKKSTRPQIDFIIARKHTHKTQLNAATRKTAKHSADDEHVQNTIEHWTELKASSVAPRWDEIPIKELNTLNMESSRMDFFFQIS
jgi:hypothetical protein